MSRLKLIWLALTASSAVIEQRTLIVNSAIDAAWAENIRKELDEISTHHWTLMGISIGHSGDVDIRAIEWFLKCAPERIRRLLESRTS